MAKPSLESCRVDPGDGFQYLSSYQNVYRWKNRDRWKKFQNYFFLTNFLKSYFKALPEKLIFSKKHNFLKFFLWDDEIMWIHVQRFGMCPLDTMASFGTNYSILWGILRPMKIPGQNGHRKNHVFCWFYEFQSPLVLPCVA